MHFCVILTNILLFQDIFYLHSLVSQTHLLSVKACLCLRQYHYTVSNDYTVVGIIFDLSGFRYIEMSVLWKENGC